MREAATRRLALQGSSALLFAREAPVFPLFYQGGALLYSTRVVLDLTARSKARAAASVKPVPASSSAVSDWFLLAISASALSPPADRGGGQGREGGEKTAEAEEAQKKSSLSPPHPPPRAAPAAILSLFLSLSSLFSL